MKLMIAVAVAVAGAIASYLAPAPDKAPGIDPVTTASVKTHALYSAANIAENKACTVKRGQKAAGRTFQLETEPGCESVWPGLTNARHWTENADGSVALTDKAGRDVLTLARGDGIGFVAVEPPSAAVTLTALD